MSRSLADAGRRGLAIVVAGMWLAPAEGMGQSRSAEAARDPLEQRISIAAPQDARQSSSPPLSGPSLTPAVSTLVGGVAVCVGGFLLFVWATRRAAPKGLAPLPPEVLEPLGRAPLQGRNYLQLVRLGRKLILLCVTPQGATAIGEVPDADEAARLAGMCQQSLPQSVSTSFREALGETVRGLDQAHLVRERPPAVRDRATRGSGRSFA